MLDLNPGTIQAVFDPTEFAYATGVTLTGFSFALKPRGWQVIFRGRRRDGSSVYCLYVAVDLAVAVEELFNSVRNKGGSRYWYPDKFAK